MNRHEMRETICSLLQELGTLECTQIEKILRHEEIPAISSFLRRMKNEGRVYPLYNGRFLSAVPTLDYDRSRGEPNKTMIKAVWVLLEFLDTVRLDQVLESSFPGQIIFLSEQHKYEIIVIEQGEASILGMLKAQEDTTYIIVIPDLEYAQKLMFPSSGKFMLALVQEKEETDPEIAFFYEDEV